MDQKKIMRFVARAIEDRTRTTAGEVTRDTRFIEDLGADSLDRMEIVMDLEDTFKISLANEGASDLRTVGQMIDLITPRVSQCT